MRPNSNDLSFSLFGFPTFIQPFFWLVALFLAVGSVGNINNDMPIWLAKMLLGVAGVLLSVLVHEIGHALVFRHIFGTPCTIVLHGFGGMAIPQHHRRGYGFTGAVAECFLAFSGPLAGFVLAFFAIILLLLIPENPENAVLATVLFCFFLEWTAFISIVWGVLNLLPIYPMDGGHISREVFTFFSPRRGVNHSLILSMTLAVLLAVWGLQSRMILLTIIFAIFAYQNYQEWSMRSFRR